MNLFYSQRTAELFNKYLDIYNIYCCSKLCYCDNQNNQATKAVLSITNSCSNDFIIHTSFYCIDCFDHYKFSSNYKCLCVDLKNFNEEKAIKYFKNLILMQ
jgi:hypothetical protein